MVQYGVQYGVVQYGAQCGVMQYGVVQFSEVHNVMLQYGVQYGVVQCGFEVCSGWQQTQYPSLWPGGKTVITQMNWRQERRKVGQGGGQEST